MEKLVLFFSAHRLNVNDKKTEFSIFCKSIKILSVKDHLLNVGNHKVEQIECVKYLGVQLDRNLIYQNDETFFFKKWPVASKLFTALGMSYPNGQTYFY